MTHFRLGTCCFVRPMKSFRSMTSVGVAIMWLALCFCMAATSSSTLYFIEGVIILKSAAVEAMQPKVAAKE